MGALTVVRRPFILSGDPVVLSASPGAPALTPGAELLTDPGLETWASATDLTSWTEVLTGTSTVNREASVIHGGSFAARFDIDASNNAADIRQSITNLAGAWIQISLWARGTDTNQHLRTYAGGYGASKSLTGTYAQYTDVYRVGANELILFNAIDSPSASVYIDDLSTKQLPFDQTGVLEYIGDAGVKLGIAKANITVAAGYHAGFVVCADSATAPTNSIWTYYDRTAGKVYLMKNTTELIAATVTYSAAAEQRVMIVGAVTAAYISLYYGGVLQGTVQGPYDLSAYGSHCHKFATSENETVDRFTFTRW